MLQGQRIEYFFSTLTAIYVFEVFKYVKMYVLLFPSKTSFLYLFCEMSS